EGKMPELVLEKAPPIKKTKKSRKTELISEEIPQLVPEEASEGKMPELVLEKAPPIKKTKKSRKTELS
ncbi:MAG: hypothetical protein QGF23_02945, partial [Dehalococcoidales bacterium]|nr:hypothetical protein [Dehalococcoidales bacterium]